MGCFWFVQSPNDGLLGPLQSSAIQGSLSMNLLLEMSFSLFLLVYLWHRFLEAGIALTMSKYAWWIIFIYCQIPLSSIVLFFTGNCSLWEWLVLSVSSQTMLLLDFCQYDRRKEISHLDFNLDFSYRWGCFSCSWDQFCLSSSHSPSHKNYNPLPHFLGWYFLNLLF